MPERKFFNEVGRNRCFFVCSYGGSGTVMLARRLSQYGKVEVVHSLPPIKLESVKSYKFSGEALPDEEVKNITVIYIYKNPVNVVYSRYNKEHFRRFLRFEGTFEELVEKKQDVFGLEKFFNAWVEEGVQRNYKVICVNYKYIFENQNELCKVLGIEKLNLVKRERERETPHKEVVEEVYKGMSEKIDAMPFIKII